MKRFVLQLLFALVLSGGLAGCFAKRGIPPPWPRFAQEIRRDPAAVADALSKRDYSWKNIQARILFSVEGTHPRQPEMQGDLLLRPPQDARLRAYTPLGTIAFDLLYKERFLELYLPHRREVVVVPLESMKTLAFGGIPMSLPKAEDWLRMIKPWREAKGNARYALEPQENPAKGILAAGADRYLFDWDSGRIESLKLGNQFILTYQDWEFFDGRELASRIDLVPISSGPGDAKGTFQLRLKLLEVHEAPEFPPQVFDSVDMTQLKVTRLQK